MRQQIADIRNNYFASKLINAGLTTVIKLEAHAGIPTAKEKASQSFPSSIALPFHAPVFSHFIMTPRVISPHMRAAGKRRPNELPREIFTSTPAHRWGVVLRVAIVRRINHH